MKTKFLPFYLLILLCFSAYAEEPKDGIVTEYLAMKPDFVVNLVGNRHSYLRTNIQLLIENKEHSERIKTHIPAMRHALIMLMSDYSADQLRSQEQREEFRKKALGQTREALDKYASSKGLMDLYFTKFLVQ